MKIQRVFTAVFLAFALLLANVAVARAMPPLPSSFYGTVKLDGANVPTGTVVSARINGVIYAWGTALIYEGDTVYTFDVPGEDTDEPGIQGGVPGDTVVFYIGDYIADQTAPWQGGTLEELNLTASTNRTVVFDANGGTGTMSPQVANAPTALTLNAFARSGYTFSGWNTAANGSGTSYADGATYPFAADATLYAQWTANSYTVTFNANGGTAPSPATKPVTFGSAYGALATTSRTGYAFAGWFTAETGGTEVTAATIVSNTADHTLYAHWTANSYTVTFDANGGTAPSPATKPVTFGSAYGALATTSRTGYAFVGWFTAETGGTEVTAATIVSNTADHTLYAHWTANSYTVTFNANGGTAPSPATKPVTFGSAYGALATTSRTGYAFAGWFTAETGGTEVTAATIVSNTADHTTPTGRPTPTATKPVTFGSAYGALATTSRTGYAFVGWFTAETGGTEVTAATIVSNTADHTLYAHWTANSYTVTFNANGGTAPSPATKPVTFGSAYGALATTSRTGYAFAGWFTAETGGTEVTAATIVSNTADHTLYAHWTINAYAVTFKANGGSGSMSNQTGNYNTTAPLTLNAFTRTGYAFTGWNTQANGGGTPYANGANYTFIANITLYAQWSANSYTVTFDANGGTAPSPATKPVTFDAAYGALAATSRAGFVFNGWFTAASGGTEVTAATIVSNAADHTLYAQWDEIDAITVTGITVSNKVYDGNTNAAFDASGYVLVGVTGGDIVTLDTTGASAAFDNKNAGAAKVVTLSGLSLGGKDAHKYTLTPPTLSADIAAKDLTVSATASNKPYDGSTAALATLSTDALAGDAVTATFTAADFDTADVGAGKTVTVTGIAIEGADAGNYNLLNVTAAATADITAGEITVTADDQTKVANQPDPVFTYTASGFAGTDAFVTPPTCSVPAAHTVPGEYDIVCSGGDPGANYVVTSYVNGKFTVTAIQIQKRTFRSSGAQDGWILESAENGNKGWTMNKAATTLRIGDEADRKQYRSILSFATGATLPDNAVIVKVTLKVRQQSVTGSGNPLTIFQGIMVDIRKGAFGATSLQITDWQTKASKTMGPFKTAATSGWFTFNLNPSKAFINKLGTSGGVTQIRLRFKLDDNNNSVANYLSLFSGNAPFASRPQLIVEYYIP